MLVWSLKTAILVGMVVNVQVIENVFLFSIFVSLFPPLQCSTAPFSVENV
jgi:hypothetical protein